MLVRPEFGPTLPELLRGRGVPPRAIAAGAILLAVVLAVTVFLVTRRDESELAHRSDPQFTLLYDPAFVRPVDVRPGELTRLEGRDGRLRAEVSVRPLRLPAYRGDVAHGLLPVHVERRKTELRRELEGFTLTDEGRANVNRAPGYQLGYRQRMPGEIVTWRELYVVPDEPGAREGVVLVLRQAKRGRRITADDREWFKGARSAMRSFRFGLDRP